MEMELFGFGNIYYRPQTKFAKVMFFTGVCHSVHREGSTWVGTPPETRYTPGTRYTPRRGTPPSTRYPPAPGTPSPPPPDQVHPPGPGTPPGQVPTPREQCMLGDAGNKRAVRILLECILVEFCFPINAPR